MKPTLFKMKIRQSKETITQQSIVTMNQVEEMQSSELDRT